jgi:hypothetical protein
MRQKEELKNSFQGEDLIQLTLKQNITLKEMQSIKIKSDLLVSNISDIKRQQDFQMLNLNNSISNIKERIKDTKISVLSSIEIKRNLNGKVEISVQDMLKLTAKYRDATKDIYDNLYQLYSPIEGDNNVRVW